MKTKLCSLWLLMFALTFSFIAKADTEVIKSGSGGWTKITSLPDEIGDYYFVFVDKDNDLMLSFGEGNNQSTDAAYKTMVYRTSEDPAMNPAMLWTLTVNNDGYSIKSAVEETYYIQTEYNAEWFCRTHDNGGGDANWYKWLLAYSDGSWTIQNGKYTDKGYIGGWDATPKNGLNVAANNTASEKIGHFHIYSILKSDVDWLGNATESKPANLSYRIANSYAAFNGVTGWTGTDTQTRNGNTGFDGIPGFFEFCNWGAESWSGSLSQTITGLPAGKYRVRVAGQLHESNTTMTLDVNGTKTSFPANGTSNGTILASGVETTEGSGVAGWRYVSVEKNIASGTNLVITLSSSAKAVNRWANFDNVELYCLGITDAYTGWQDATMEAPLDWTSLIISGWECTSNDAWPGNGRTTDNGTYYDGSSRTYFTQNHENGAARSQTVTLPKPGVYKLRTIVRPVSAASYATISFGSESTTTRGIQTGTADIGHGWAYNDVYVVTSTANESKTISIALSNVNNSREADCGEMHLYYLGSKADFVMNGVHKYVGTYATAPALEVTDNVPVVDVTNAIFTSGTSAVTFTNPNGLVFVKTDGQTSAAKNEVVGTTCASLQLTDGHPFVNPTAFTATSATYTLSALAGGEFATLMLPFTATTLSGSAYTLDQGVDLMDGNIRGTAVSSIAANTPVIVTASGNYTGSNVTVPVVAQGATYTNGELVGVYSPTAAPTSSYVLQNHSDRVAFYLVGTTQPTVNPFRAYIKPQASNVRALHFTFDGVTDGINGVEGIRHGEKENPVYDLIGRQMGNSKLKKGIYIVNGKRVIIR